MWRGCCCGFERGRSTADAPGTQPDHCTHPLRRSRVLGPLSEPATASAPHSSSCCCSSPSSSSSPASGWHSSFPSRSRARLKLWPTPWMKSRQANTNIASRSSPPAKWPSSSAPSTTWHKISMPAASLPKPPPPSSQPPTSPSRSAAVSSKPSSKPFLPAW